MSESDDNSLARIMRGAGPREPVPQDVRKRMKDVLINELATTQRKRVRRRMQIGGLAMAACVALVALILMPPPPASEVVEVALVDRQHGAAFWLHDSLRVPLRVGNRVRTGDHVVTAGDGALALVPIANGLDIRLDRDTEITIVDRNSFRLHRGALYVDAQPGVSAPLAILTRELTIEHVGTQYLVSIDQSDNVAVAVREGEVRINQGDHQMSITADGEAELVSISADNTMTRRTISAWEDRWHWAAQNAPQPGSKRMPLIDFLTWVEHESGYPIHYATPDVADAVASKDHVIVGVNTNDVIEALHTVMLSDQFTAEIADGRIVVSLETPY